MLNSKKGLSAIVTTLLIIVLVLVAVGVVWAVVRGVIQSGAGSTELAVKCLNTDIQITSANCDIPTACTITFARTGSSNEPISGIYLIFRDATGTAGQTTAVDITGNIEKLIGATKTAIGSGLPTPVKIEATVYFEDASGNAQACSQQSTYTF